MNLQIDIKKDAQIETVLVKGEIDAYTAPELREKLFPLAEKNNVELIIDLSEVSYIDSTGLGVFIGAYKTVKQNGGTFKLVGVNERVLRLFKITGLNEIITIGGGEA